jgi:hypothetical protein
MILLFSAATLLAGCGGGNDSGRDGTGQGQAGGQAQGGGGESAEETKIALGTVGFVNAEKRRLTVKPHSEQQGDKPLDFRIAKNTEVRLDGKEAELQDIKEGQQVRVEYVGGKARNRARTVDLFGGEG